MWNTYWSSSSSLPNMKAIHWRIKVKYNWKKVNQKVNLERRPIPAHTDIALLRDPFFKKNFSKNIFLVLWLIVNFWLLLFWVMVLQSVPSFSYQFGLALSIYFLHLEDVQIQDSSYSSICGQWRPRSACASVQSDQGLHCPLTKSLDTTEFMNGEQRHRWYFAYVQKDLNFTYVQRHISLHVPIHVWHRTWKTMIFLLGLTWNLYTFLPAERDTVAKFPSILSTESKWCFSPEDNDSSNFWKKKNK